MTQAVSFHIYKHTGRLTNLPRKQDEHKYVFPEQVLGLAATSFLFCLMQIKCTHLRIYIGYSLIQIKCNHLRIYIGYSMRQIW